MAEAGEWQIEVIASEIVQDSHVETPEVDADFALVVSGVQPVPPALLVSLPPDLPSLVDFPDEDALLVEISDNDGATWTELESVALPTSGWQVASFRVLLTLLENWTL